jgi:cytochrome c553
MARASRIVAGAALAALLGGCTTADGAAAEPAAPPTPEPPDLVERLAAACDGCHGPDGRGSGAVPPLAGWDAEHLAARLIAFHEMDDTSGGDHLMVRFAQPLEPALLRDLAEYYAGLPAP